MSYSSAKPVSRYTSSAGLYALGLYLRSVGFWDPIDTTVHIAQKTVRYRPLEKLRTAVCLFLSGAEHIVETNKRLRGDPALCEALGCAPCEQSVLQETLSACTRSTVEEYHLAAGMIFQRFSRACRHDFQKAMLVLDIDLSGLTCGKTAEGATKGYFAHRKNKTGRQAGRVLASAHNEVVTDDVFVGTEQLAFAVPRLLEEASRVLNLTKETKARTLVRLDAGGGTKGEIEGLIQAGYQILVKIYAWHTATAMRRQVQRWIDDPRTPGRHVGWVPTGTKGYPDNVSLVGLRFVKANGTEGGAVIATTLSANQVIALVGWPKEDAKDPDRVLLATTLLYDQRGGGVETAFREDKQGLGLDHCNKRSLAGQQMITGMIALAHNLTVWAREWLGAVVPDLRRFGIVRMLRDVLGVRGCVTTNKGSPVRITLAETEPYVAKIAQAFIGLCSPHIATLHLGEI